MFTQCSMTSHWICTTPASKQPIIVKGRITGIVAPCSVVTPPEPTLQISSFANDGFGPEEPSGTPLVQPCFTATYTGEPAIVTLCNDAGFPDEDIALPATSFCSAHTYPGGVGTVTWTLKTGTSTATSGVDFVMPDVFNITSFTTPDFGATSELGDPGIVNPDFNVTFDTVPTNVVFSDNKGNSFTVPGPYSTNMTFNAPFTYNPDVAGTICTFTITADNGGTPDAETIQTQFICNQYIGWLLGAGAGLDPTYTPADILGMNELVTQPTTDGLFDVTLTPDPAAAGGDVYVVQAFCCDVDLTRSPTDYRIGGAFPGGFVQLPDLVINGLTYCIWRTSIDQDGVPTGGVQYEAFQ